MSQQQRRAEVDARFEAVESDVKWVVDTVSGLKRTVDSVAKSCKIVVEGFKQCEEAWQGMVLKEQKDWRKLKADFPGRMCQDVKSHLGGAAQEGEVADMVRKLEAGLATPGVIVNINDQSKAREGSDVRDHIGGTFKIQLRFGIEALEIQKILLALDRYMRRSSGMMVEGQSTAVEGQNHERSLIYNEKTAWERSKGKGKGKDKGKEGEQAAKGKGKKGKGKKGKGEGKPAAKAAAGL